MRIRLGLLLPAVLFVSSAAYGQGIIIPRECQDCIPRPIPRPVPIPRVLKIKSVKITTRIEAQVAATTVEQIFENETPYRLEGSYFFPIPESASISDFAIYDGEKRMSGEVMERSKARQIYQEIVRKLIDPGLLEYVGKDLFQARVFPIEPRSTRKIELTYTQVLKAEGGTVSYRYPLGSGRRMLPQPVNQVAASVEIISPVDLKNVFSPSHKISVSRDGERRARLSFEGAGEATQQDFQLYYSLSEQAFGVSLVTHREPKKDGYFLMLISPKVNLREDERLAKDVVFVLDTSGSMSGEKLDKAKAALKFGVESLSARDRFNLISFSGEEHLMRAGLVTASKEVKQQAAAFIDGLRAEGGTNINDSLVAALRLFEKSERPSMIVFLTDGLPTVGPTDVNTILKNVTDADRAGIRLFTFGVGYDVNTTLLDRLASDHRGSSDYIEPKEDLEIKVSNFFAKVNYPVLSDLKLDLGGVETDLIYPRTMPDLFKGSQLVLVGRYKNSVNAATIHLSGKIGGKTETFSYREQRFPAENSDNKSLPRLWAVRRVGYLLEQIRLNGANRELTDEIVALGTRFGIVTPYTSFLVTEDLKDLARRPMAEEFRVLAAPKAADAAGQGTGSGQAAVGRSRAEKKLAESELAGAGQYFNSVSNVGNKTFLLKEGVWTDSEYKEGTQLPTIRVKFGSSEFFDLIAKRPELVEFFAVGQKVTVVFKGTVYVVTID